MSLTPFVASFALVALAELGDKTQIAVITLSSRFKALSVFFSDRAMAFALVTWLGATLGTALARFVPVKYIQLGSGIVFMLLGTLFLIDAVFEYAPLA